MLANLRFVVAVGALLAPSLPLRAARAQDRPAGSVYVELQTDNPAVRVDQVLPSGEQRPMCFAPCRRALDRDAVYVIDGDGIAPTSQFSLPAERPNLVLVVHPRWRMQGGVGFGLVIVGYGAMIMAYALAGDLHPPSEQTWPERHPTAWFTMGGGGLALAAVGGILMLTSRTRVDSSTGRSFTAAPPAPRKRPLFALTARGLEF